MRAVISANGQQLQATSGDANKLCQEVALTKSRLEACDSERQNLNNQVLILKQKNEELAKQVQQDEQTLQIKDQTIAHLRNQID